MAKLTVSFTLDSEKDRDLVHWLERLPHRRRSAAIRETLRAGLARGGVTLGDVYQAVKELERKIRAGAVTVDHHPENPEGWEEPPEAVAALDALADLA